LKRRRIGIYGGSFDPVHVAHLALARLALDHLGLDELRWLPTGHAYQKDRRLSDDHHRVAMLQRATAGEPRFVVDGRELRREGPSYTIDTVNEMQAEEDADWFLVVGQDQYANLPTWRRWRDLLPMVTWAVARRAGDEPAAPPEVAALPHRVEFLPLPAMDVSSTDIRARRARNEGIGGLVPPAVAAYIETHHLYRS
jgi:nicotinate-nucleotide adenylyltransferase